jgi:hypothetical protein
MKELCLIIETVEVTKIDCVWVVQGDDGKGHVRASIRNYPTEHAAIAAYFAGQVRWEE